jgi:hypothetical protein
MTPGARVSIVVLFILMVALSVANLLYTSAEVNGNNHQWCDALGVLTSQPVPRPANPAANPSRVQTYTLYIDFVMLEHRFGC